MAKVLKPFSYGTNDFPHILYCDGNVDDEKLNGKIHRKEFYQTFRVGTKEYTYSDKFVNQQILKRYLPPDALGSTEKATAKSTSRPAAATTTTTADK